MVQSQEKGKGMKHERVHAPIEQERGEREWRKNVERKKKRKKKERTKKKRGARKKKAISVLKGRKARKWGPSGGALA